MALVLCTGTDRNLVETWKMILEEAGHTVMAALDEVEIRKTCEQHKFDVVVIGQAISDKHKVRLFSIVRVWCASAKVLELYVPWAGKMLPGADDWLAVAAAVPTGLADRVAALAHIKVFSAIAQRK
jgi:hypothetical protein